MCKHSKCFPEKRSFQKSTVDVILEFEEGCLDAVL